MKNINTVKRQTPSKNSADFFETQDSTIDILWDNYLKNISSFKNSVVADLSCGNFAILNRLIQKVCVDTNNNFYVFGSDILQRHPRAEIIDMFYLDKHIEILEILEGEKEIHIVMNPPFNMLTKTMKYYLELKKKYPNIKSLSLLHSVRALEGQQRHKIMEDLGYPSLILNMSKRQSFNTYFGEEKRTWTPPFSVCWSIWDDNYEGKTEFRYAGG